MPTRTYARNFILANWRGIPFALLVLNRYLTGLEGMMGAGKTTLMAGYVTAMMPNQKLLNFPNVGADGTREGRDAGLWGRLGEEATAYSLIEWINPEGRSIWAGVTLKRQAEPSIEIKPFIVEGVRATLNPSDAFLIHEEGDTVFVPPFTRLRDHLTMLGARVFSYRTVTEYLRALFEYGITPMAMSLYEEQERFYRVLATSMMGSSLGAIAKTGLRSYLLNEDASLEKRVNIMRGCLEECRQTKRELERTQKAYDEIHGLYDAAWKMASYAYFGTLARFEQANEAWHTQVSTTRRERMQHTELTALLAELTQRLAEFAEQEATAIELVKARSATLDRALKAREFRQQLQPVDEAQRRAEQSQVDAVRARDEAQAQESEAAQAWAVARREWTSLTREMGDLQVAIEELTQRVTRLHVARARFARARSVVGEHVTEQNAKALSLELEEQYAALTTRHNALKSELDARTTRQAQFDRLFAQLKAICERDGAPVSMKTAYERAVALDVKLRDRQSAASRLPDLESHCVQLARLRDRQDQVQAAASRLGLTSSQDLMEKSGAQRDSIARQDAERERQIQQKNTLITELGTINDTIRRLEEADKTYRQGREYHQSLSALDAELGTIATRDDLQHARDEASKRHQLVTDRRRAIEAQIQSMSTSILALRANYGTVDPLVGSIAEQVDGTLLASRFEHLNLEEAARTQARLGDWTESIVVPSPTRAARIASEIEDRPDTLFFVGEDYVSPEQIGVVVGDSEQVNDGLVSTGVRLTRRPAHPTLGQLARKAEIERLEGLKRTLESDLSTLRAHSGVLTETLTTADHYLILGPAAWRDDPGPALAHEHSRKTALHTMQDALDRDLVQAKKALERARELQRRYDELEPRRELLDPPHYRDKVRELDAEIAASRDATAWLAELEQPARQVLNELPILNTAPDKKTIKRLTDTLAQVETQRLVASTHIEALTAFVLVARDLQYAGDEDVHQKKSSVIKSLKPKLARAEERNTTAAARHEAATKVALDARMPVNEADVTLARCQASLATLIQQLNETGMQGTEEEIAAASAALADAQKALEHTRSANTTASERKGETKADLERAQETLAAANRDVADKYQTIRSERSGKRELDAMVAEQNLSGKIDSEGNRHELIPTGISQIRAFEVASEARAFLLERLKVQPEVLKEIQAIDIEEAERRAVQTLRIWARVLEHIEQRIPRNLASTDDPRLALAQMQEKLKEMHRTLDAQEHQLRQASVGVSNAIRTHLRTAGRLILRLNHELEKVEFGSIQGVRIAREEPPHMMELLEALEGDQNRSLIDTEVTLDETLAKLYEHVGGGRIKGADLLDYRNYVNLHVEVRRLDGTWDPTANLSTGEAIGVGASILVMILRTWNEEPRRISGASAGYSLQQILLDEANRLHPEDLDRLTEFCQRMDVQALVAAPSLAQPRSSTVYTLVRAMQEGRELVTIEGRRFAA